MQQFCWFSFALPFGQLLNLWAYHNLTMYLLRFGAIFVRHAHLAHHALELRNYLKISAGPERGRLTRLKAPLNALIRYRQRPRNRRYANAERMCGYADVRMCRYVDMLMCRYKDTWAWEVEFRKGAPNNLYPYQCPSPPPEICSCLREHMFAAGAPAAGQM